MAWRFIVIIFTLFGLVLSPADSWAAEKKGSPEAKKEAAEQTTKEPEGMTEQELETLCEQRSGDDEARIARCMRNNADRIGQPLSGSEGRNLAAEQRRQKRLEAEAERLKLERHLKHERKYGR